MAIATLTISACVFPLDATRTWFEAENATGGPLDIVYDRAAGLVLARDVPPGSKVNISNPGEPSCTEHDVVARNQAGEEVARHPPPLCGGDVWTIRDDSQ